MTQAELYEIHILREELDNLREARQYVGEKLARAEAENAALTEKIDALQKQIEELRTKHDTN